MTSQDDFSLNALAVRSPMSMGGEAKDQDRVFVSHILRTACVCDGLSASPYSEDAAEIAANFSPALFRDGACVESSLRALSHLLEVRRIEAQQASLNPPPGSTPEMQLLLHDIAAAKLAESYQTTLVAAHATPHAGNLDVNVVVVGDSAFFAFAHDGTLIASSLSAPANAEPDLDSMPDGRAIGVHYGDRLMAKVLCPANERPALAKLAGLSHDNAGDWLLCLPLDRCEPARTREHRRNGPTSIVLQPDGILAVPRYLVKLSKDPALRGYGRMTYSRAIRSTRRDTELPVSLRQVSTATAVLPEHYFAGNWANFHEVVPADGCFVLASDGFYSCFASPADLWKWLKDNEDALQDIAQRDQVLQDLHQRLHRTCGDDDISFVWVRAQAGNLPSKE